MSGISPYDDEFKKAVLARISAGESQTKIAAELGLGGTTITRWKHKATKGNQKQPISHEAYLPKVITQSVVLAIPDMHCPFEHPHALLFLQSIKAKYQPTHIIQLGDEVDFHAMSRYPHDPNGHSAGHELREAIDHLIPFYREFPQVMVCESNHTIRGHKAAFQAGLPQAFLNHIATVLNAPDGWKWASHWIIDDTRYFHGDCGRSGQYAHMQYLKMFKQNLVHGHIHSFAGVNYEGNHFGANSGCLISEEAYAFAYGKHFPIRPSLGCTIVFGGRRATFIPMLTDANNNWVGYI